VIPKIAAAPSSRPTTTLAAAGATNRFIGQLLGSTGVFSGQT
jgi:hypothetical protein